MPVESRGNGRQRKLSLHSFSLYSFRHIGVDIGIGVGMTGKAFQKIIRIDLI